MFILLLSRLYSRTTHSSKENFARW